MDKEHNSVGLSSTTTTTTTTTAIIIIIIALCWTEHLFIWAPKSF